MKVSLLFWFFSFLVSVSAKAQDFKPAIWVDQRTTYSWKYLGYVPLANAMHSCNLLEAFFQILKLFIKPLKMVWRTQDLIPLGFTKPIIS